MGTDAPTVLVTHSLPAGSDALLDRSWEVWRGESPMPREELLKRARAIEGLLCMLVDRVDTELIEAAPKLRVISQMAVGVDNIDLDTATQRGIAVGHTPDVLTETTADTAFAILASVVRRLPEGQQILRDGEFGDWDPEFLLGGDLGNTVLGIVGLGRIGQAVARRAQGFGMEILYSGPRRKVEGDDLGAAWVPLEHLMKTSDHVVATAPLTADTRQLFDGDLLWSMKPGATFVNVARGGLVDHDALTDVARSGHIRVGLDVTEPEPLPTDHELLHLPNVLVVPHLASASVRTRRAMAEMAVANLRAGLEGRELRACANPGFATAG